MTTIVYHQGALYGDRCHIRAGTPVTSYLKTKIFTSADKQFAYGVSGRSIQEHEHAGLEKIIRQGLEKLLTADMGDQIASDKIFSMAHIEKLMDYGGWVVMTKTRTFIVLSLNVREATGATMGIGTGNWIACGMIYGGASPEYTLANLGDLDPCTTGPVDRIVAKSLKPLIVAGGAK